MTPAGLFKLYFSHNIMELIANSTNAYAEIHKGEKTTYTNTAGDFKKTNVPELYKLLGLIIYMGVVQVPFLSDYWSTGILLHGLWARAFMGREGFKALLAFLHIDDP
jgi:hypothetical protein